MSYLREWQSLEVRLHRALEEISKQKEAVRQTRGQHKDIGQGQRLEVSRLEGQCQRLERQKVLNVVASVLQHIAGHRDVKTALRGAAACDHVAP